MTVILMHLLPALICLFLLENFSCYISILRASAEWKNVINSVVGESQPDYIERKSCTLMSAFAEVTCSILTKSGGGLKSVLIQRISNLKLLGLRLSIKNLQLVHFILLVPIDPPKSPNKKIVDSQ